MDNTIDYSSISTVFFSNNSSKLLMFNDSYYLYRYTSEVTINMRKQTKD